MSLKDLDKKTWPAVEATRASSSRKAQDKYSMDLTIESQKLKQCYEENMAEMDRHLGAMQVQVDRLDSKM